MKIIASGKAPAAVGPYSQAIAYGGVVYFSGQIPIVPETGLLISGDITEQTERVLMNLTAVTEEAGGSLGKVIKCTVFMTDLNNFAKMNEVYAKYFGDHKPARSTIQVAGLPRGASIEIEAIMALV